MRALRTMVMGNSGRGGPADNQPFGRRLRRPAGAQPRPSRRGFTDRDGKRGACGDGIRGRPEERRNHRRPGDRGSSAPVGQGIRPAHHLRKKREEHDRIWPQGIRRQLAVSAMGLEVRLRPQVVDRVHRRMLEIGDEVTSPALQKAIDAEVAGLSAACDPPLSQALP